MPGGDSGDLRFVQLKAAASGCRCNQRLRQAMLGPIQISATQIKVLVVYATPNCPLAGASGAARRRGQRARASYNAQKGVRHV